MITVCSESQLKKALKNKENKIEIVGDYATKFKKLKPVFNLSRTKKIAICTALGVATMGNPLGTTAFATVAMLTGKEICGIIFASGVSLAIVIAAIKGYKIEINNGVVVLSKEGK